MRRLWITGTDTGVGKTTVSLQLLKQWASAGLKTVALKPVASGGVMTEAGLRNEDALQLQAAATVKLPYASVNPVLLPLPIAPHLAAEQAGCKLSVAEIVQACQSGLSQPADIVLLEGAGGWLVPLNANETMADLARAFDAEVVLVVALRLGCLNHALLTSQAIQASGARFAGWIANQASATAMPYQAGNIAALCQRIPAPLLCVVGFLGVVDRVS